MTDNDMGASADADRAVAASPSSPSVSPLRASIPSAVPDPRGGPSLHGAVLGRALAAIADHGAVEGERLPARCKCCAFRLGSMPNQCAMTVSDALSALTGEADDFMCHHGLTEAGEPTNPCWGFQAAKRVPFGWFSEHLERAYRDLPSEGSADPVRAAYVAWLATADPDNRLDDYQRAALYAQAIEARRAETANAGSVHESAVAEGHAPETSGETHSGDQP